MPFSSGSPFHAGYGRSSSRAGGADGKVGTSPQAQPSEETLYQLLGVPYTASGADITRAYRRAMKRVHPDRVHADRREAHEALARLYNDAYATLRDPAKRRAYDATIRDQAVQEQIMGRYVGGFGGPGMGGHDPFAQALKRERSAFERHERVRANRSAVITIMAAFGGAAAVIIAVILIVAALGWAFGAVF